MRISEKQHDQLQYGESGLMAFCIAVFALIFVIWLCHDTSAGISEAVEHQHHEVNALHWLGLI